jgi:succinate dehydrogenase / fumarate reductase cytochrome b subunit
MNGRLAAPNVRDAGRLRRLAYWLEPRWRDPGWLAFALNRLTGHILIAYLAVHLIVLSQLAAGPAGWDGLVGIFGSRPFLVADTLLIAAILFHALNGARVVALTMGLGARRPGVLFASVLGATIALSAVAGWAILS